MKQLLVRIPLLVMLALSLLTGFALVHADRIRTASAFATQVPAAPAPQFSGGEPSVGMQMMYHSVWEYVRDQYYDQNALKHWSNLEHAYDDRLSNLNDLNLAIKLMMATLHDKWTYFTSPQEVIAAANLRNQGVVTSGLELYQNGSRYSIDVINYQSPAYNKGFRERDVVESVNGVDITNLSKEQVDGLLRGPKGTRLAVTAVAQADSHPYTVDLTLAATPADQVEGRLLAGNIIYLRLPSFEGEAHLSQLLKKFTELSREAGGHVDGIVLDLRNNRGGDITVAGKLVSLFLPDDHMTMVKSFVRYPQGVKETDIHVIPLGDLKIDGSPVDAKIASVLKSTPMVVLENGSSASASEVTIGALKDNHRATVIGDTSFGKGVGYKVSPGPIGGVILVTAMYYLTPDGYNVQGKGISPDLKVESPGRAGDHDSQLEAATHKLLQH